MSAPSPRQVGRWNIRCGEPAQPSPPTGGCAVAASRRTGTWTPRRVSQAIGTEAATSAAATPSKRVAAADQPGKHQAHDLTETAQRLQRANSVIPFVWRPHLDNKHVRHSVRSGEAYAKDRSEHRLERKAELTRHEQQRHQRRQHPRQQHLPMQPPTIGEMAPEWRGQTGEVHHTDNHAGVCRPAGGERQQHRQHSALHDAEARIGEKPRLDPRQQPARERDEPVRQMRTAAGESDAKVPAPRRPPHVPYRPSPLALRPCYQSRRRQLANCKRNLGPQDRSRSRGRRAQLGRASNPGFSTSLNETRRCRASSQSARRGHLRLCRRLIRLSPRSEG